jgi:hypothetical protein
MNHYSSKLVTALQNWKQLGENNMTRLNKALKMYSNAVAITESEFLQQPKSLLEQIIITIINTDDNTSFDKIKKCIYDNVTDEKANSELTKLAQNEIDLKRVITNHSIINKRFNIQQLFINQQSYIYKALNSAFPQLAIIELCKLLDTYNLSIQDKFALMTEEICYLCNKYSCSNAIQYIIPTIHSYMYSIYNPSDASVEDLNKVNDSITQKLNNSVYIRQKIVNNLACDSVNRSIFECIKSFEETIDEKGISEVFISLAKLVNNTKSAEEVFKSILVLYYQYIIVAECSFDKDKAKSLIYDFIDEIFNNNESRFIDILYKFNEVCDNFLSVIHILKNTSEKLNNLLLFTKALINDAIEFNTAKNDYVLEKDKYDINDNPLKLFSDYDLTLINDINKAYSIFQSNILEESTINTFTNKDVLLKADEKLLAFIEESYEAYYPLIKKSKLVLSLNEAITELRKNKPDIENMTKIAQLKNIKEKVLSYDTNKDDMKSLNNFIDKDFLSGRIICTTDDNRYSMQSYTAKVLSKNCYNENTILANNIAKVIIHEMKLSSYITLGLDKLKQGTAKISDNIKNASTAIDRFAYSIEKINNEENKKDARIQAVNNDMLPPMATCIKTILAAGALAVLVHPYIGLVALVAKFVSSRNASKEERQAVVDELEVELEMIDRKIRDAEDNKDEAREKRLRLLKRRLISIITKFRINDKLKWDSGLMFKKDYSMAQSELGGGDDD